ncbi:hypothetical protein NP233_g7321 [Leucocoprinus birnbaumii]|uniref:DUF6533 domain-containing protein n=1 Tax=Leucocoprinus birnbaumii TaxID=56174 RepID=A0AAD5VPG1_9AGAR|nr:hypothetical protein NP233_g7321 [Leucocoprinus birnbaumii]
MEGPSPYEDKLEAFQTNCVAFASFTVLVWDHIDTFADEVEYIWKGRKGLCTPLPSPLNSPVTMTDDGSEVIYLFFFNRYFTPLGFIVNFHAFLSPLWTPEGVTVSLAVESVGLMMLLRIRAVYSNQIWITLFLSLLLLIETGINAWLIANAGPVIHNSLSRETSCSIIYDQTTSYRRILASSSAWIPLLYDTIIFILTLNKTIPPLRRSQASYIVQRLLEDGLLYYSVILIVTLILTIMLLTAPEGTRNILSQITVAMMSRITLNLRKAGRRKSHQTLGRPASPSDLTHHEGDGRRSFWLLRLFPASRDVIQRLWERGSTFQNTYFNDDTQIQSTNVGLVNTGGINVTIESETRVERGEGGYELSQMRREPLGIKFAKTPDSLSYDGHQFP